MESLYLIADVSAWSKENNLKRNAVIISSSSIKEIFEQSLAPDVSDYERRTFEACPSAISWLNDCGFSE